MKSFLFLGALFLVVGAFALVVAVDDSALHFVQTHLNATCDVANSCRGTLRLTGGILAAVFLPMGAIFVYLGAPTRAGGKKPKGTKARAIITDAKDTGVSVQGSPWMDLTMMIERPGQPSYSQSTRTVVPRSYGSHVPPGLSIPVILDALDPTKIDIDWAGATAPR